jgi:sugar transferase (PEP-CTERM/EpsH1 system associated)
MKILWLKTELLHPVDKGGKIRTYEMLKRLRQNHFITYLTLVSPSDDPESFDRSNEYCHRLAAIPHRVSQKFGAGFYSELGLNLVSPLPYALQKYRSSAMRRAIAHEMSLFEYDVVVCDFLAPSVNLPSEMSVPTVLFQHNVEAMIWERHYKNETGGLKKAYLYNQWKKMYNYERKACSRFEAVVAVSEIDRDLMRKEFGVDQVFDVPTGVDTQYFQPAGAQPIPSELVFTGSMDWMPNEDAIIYFTDEILPRIAAQIPEVTLTVVGRNPTGRLEALAEKNERVKLTGRVEDIRPYVDRAAAYVVPLRVGGGTRLKIYEAMAMGKPVISTAIGAEGLPVRDGHEILIADDPKSFAQAVVATLTDKALRERMGQLARDVVCERFGWDHAAAAFSEVCEHVQKRRWRACAA